MQLISLRLCTDDLDWGEIIDLEKFPMKPHSRILS